MDEFRTRVIASEKWKLVEIRKIDALAERESRDLLDGSRTIRFHKWKLVGKWRQSGTQRKTGFHMLD